MYNKIYEKGKIAIDAIIFTIHNRKLYVLLNKREKDPYKGKLEVPGGLLLKNESADETLKRKLEQIIGHKDLFFQQFFTFTNPKRDPRGRTISIGFIAFINKEKIKNINNWYPYTNIPNLAFDHNEIIKKAKEFLKNNISSLIIRQFMPKEFPLNKLQKAYEIIENKKYDNRNFRKKMIASGIVEETNSREINVSHRPAKLFRFTIQKNEQNTTRL